MLKRLKKLITYILTACMLCVAPSSMWAVPSNIGAQPTDMTVTENWPSAVDISARSAFVIEINSGEIIYAKNADEDRFPASITKVLTALVVLENAKLDEEITFSHNAVTDLEVGGFDARFKEGEVLTVEQCLYGLLLDSVNECGYALAEHVSGSVEEFVKLMNEKAASLGCTNSHFTNPHGLNDKDHRTTAHDMALIFWAALSNDDFYKIDSALSYEVPPTELSPHGIKFTMHHKMMQEGSEYYYKGVLAGKTGYTSLAKNTLLTYAEKDGACIVAAVLKEGTGNGVIYEDTRKLLNYAFDNFKIVDLSSIGEAIENGLKIASPFPVKMDGNLSVFLPESGGELSARISGQGQNGETIDGNVAARIEILLDGKVISSKLVTIDSNLLENGSSIKNGEIATTEEGVSESVHAGINGIEDVVGITHAEDESSQAPEEESEVTFWGVILTILKVLLYVVLGFIGLVAIYWVIVQLIKRHRRKKRKERLEKKRRLERIRSLRK